MTAADCPMADLCHIFVAFRVTFMEFTLRRNWNIRWNLFEGWISWYSGGEREGNLDEEAMLRRCFTSFLTRE